MLVRGDSLGEVDVGLPRRAHRAPHPLIDVRLHTQVEAVELAAGELLPPSRSRDADGRAERLPAARCSCASAACRAPGWAADGRRARSTRAGFILTGPDLLRGGPPPEGWPLDRDPLALETSVPGLFAAGDVRSGSVKRVAGAVGDGAMAVALAHRRLEELARSRA